MQLGFERSGMLDQGAERAGRPPMHGAAARQRRGGRGSDSKNQDAQVGDRPKGQPAAFASHARISQLSNRAKMRVLLGLPRAEGAISAASLAHAAILPAVQLRC